mmetsp:Transcript_7678/g.12490  ORF Transcript_7678/g.12490 Transcript_7678/m.12490 type:complete len:218 (-) Transcript_7678:813-1466(-)
MFLGSQLSSPCRARSCHGHASHHSLRWPVEILSSQACNGPPNTCRCSPRQALPHQHGNRCPLTLVGQMSTAVATKIPFQTKCQRVYARSQEQPECGAPACLQVECGKTGGSRSVQLFDRIYRRQRNSLAIGCKEPCANRRTIPQTRCDDFARVLRTIPVHVRRAIPSSHEIEDQFPNSPVLTAPEVVLDIGCQEKYPSLHHQSFPPRKLHGRYHKKA